MELIYILREKMYGEQRYECGDIKGGHLVKMQTAWFGIH